ncbi:hypothetical protein [Alicyclobacillus herbarius]|uniref:hypothetical protein n=1 Tax=Alicyclobacillus herbarius TaxID=122960 RepID=UPI0004229232|nr:hypothetical protein [Alicyclobacillus herbarius]
MSAERSGVGRAVRRCATRARFEADPYANKMRFAQFLAAAKLGQRLIAETAEAHQTYRVGFYAITVHTQGAVPFVAALVWCSG